MVKYKKYANAKKVLSKKEYQELKGLRETLAKRKFRKTIKDLKEEKKYLRSEAKYQPTRTGKVSKGISKGFGFLQKGVSRSLYDRGKPQITKTNGRVKYGRGRPKGTVKYRHPDTGQPIGVYEYRKILNARLRIEKQRASADSRLDPRERLTLQRLNQQRRLEQTDVERKTIPDTYGTINLGGLMDEINFSANLVK